MALTKAQVREILSEAGIDSANMKEAVDKIISGHLASIDVLREEADTHKAAAEKIQKELDELKAKGDDGWKDKHDKVKKEFDQYKADQTAKETLSAKEKAFRALAKSALDPDNTGHVKESRLNTVVKAALVNGIIDGVELNESGEAKNADKLKADISDEWPEYVVTVETRGADIAHPPANTGGGALTKEDIYKKDDKGRYVMTASERQKALIDNKLL